ncbi:hypothetical protein DB30_04305 [Enhygromyxa salina]|uniref:Archaeal ATPase n=1 Tax=Enhygromyxa salina TaxID=215803 RepID=A0A0C1ZFV4_9BACT|nr:ATP-binding protein [Enhygromyxa salina]KIG16534.1 hypothetical protein DB30_04305 [Enhygromyxa salina]
MSIPEDVDPLPARSMQPNPGGALRPDHVLGRDQLIADYWRTLQVQSLALLAPRRIGKTSIMVRMELLAPEGFVVVRRNLEGLESTSEFAQVLLEDIEQLLSTWKTKALRAREFLAKLGVVELHKIKLELRGVGWKRLLERLFDDLEEQLEQHDQTLVLMWDEVTLFIAQLINSGQAGDAMLLLDVLRAIRQSHPRVRMVLTGSIGFGELLRRLRREHGYRNRPLNDVAQRSVPLLQAGGAEALICALLRHADQALEPAFINELVQVSEGHPFVIQLLVDRVLQQLVPSRVDLRACLATLMTPPGDPLDLNHYLDRLERELDNQAAALARVVLDTVAASPDSLDRAGVCAALPGHPRDRVLATIRILEDDFYLRRNQHEQLEFMLQFVRRFWIAERGL